MEVKGNPFLSYGVCVLCIIRLARVVFCVIQTITALMTQPGKRSGAFIFTRGGVLSDH